MNEPNTHETPNTGQPSTPATPIFQPPPQWTPPQPQLIPCAVRRRFPWGWLFVVLVLLVFLGGSMLFNLILLGGIASVSATSPDQVQETLIEGNPDASQVIAVIDVSGPLMGGEQGVLGAVDSVTTIVKHLRHAANSPHVKAVVLEVDSPGGTVTASDMLYNEVLKLKAAGKKVVVHINGIGASGAYYLSAPADKIMASRASIVGSIGVIIRSYNVAELAKHYGVKSVSIASGSNKDILNPIEPLSEAHLSILQNMVNQSNDLFQEIVQKGRSLTPEQIKGISDGRIFTAADAQTAGLVHELGYVEQAYETAKALASAPGAKVVRYQRRPGLIEVILGASAKTDSSAQLQTLLRELQTPRMMYIWDPGL